MKESRNRAKEKREKIRRLLAESRSGALPLIDEPDLDSIPGLVQDLDEVIEGNSMIIDESLFDTTCSFHIDDYREHIFKGLGWNSILFSEIEPLSENSKQDKAFRFITLIFMDNDREVNISQEGNDLFIQKIYNEAHIEG